MRVKAKSNVPVAKIARVLGVTPAKVKAAADAVAKALREA